MRRPRLLTSSGPPGRSPAARSTARLTARPSRRTLVFGSVGWLGDSAVRRSGAGQAFPHHAWETAPAEAATGRRALCAGVAAGRHGVDRPSQDGEVHRKPGSRRRIDARLPARCDPAAVPQSRVGRWLVLLDRRFRGGRSHAPEPVRGRRKAGAGGRCAGSGRCWTTSTCPPREHRTGGRRPGRCDADRTARAQVTVTADRRRRSEPVAMTGGRPETTARHTVLAGYGVGLGYPPP